MTNGERYKNAFNKVADIEMKPINTRDIRRRHRQTSHFTAVAAAVICVLCLSGTVYAMGRYLGIIDFTSQISSIEIPPEGIDLIENNIQETVVDESDESFVKCEVKEALCDSETINLVVEVSAKEKNKYLFVPTDAMPEYYMSEWSDITGVTAEEYANEKQLQIVNIGGSIKNMEELGISSGQSLDFYSLSDDVMYIYYRCNKSSSNKNFEVTWVTTSLVYSENAQFSDVVRDTISFTLEDASTLTQTQYYPNDSSSDIKCEITRADVFQTEIGTYVDIYYENDSDGLFFRLVSPNGEEYYSIGGSGTVYQEDGTYKNRLILNKTSLDDTLIIEAYNCYDKTVYGRIEMKRNS